MAIKLKTIKKSDKPAKKLMAIFDVDGKEKKVHFGAAGFNDFTIYFKKDGKEKAEKMRNAYIARHSKISNFNDPLTPASLSRFVLWEEPTITGGIRAYKKRFGF